MENPTDTRVKELMSGVSTDGISLHKSQQAYKRWADNYDQDLLAVNYKAHILVTECLQQCFTQEERRTVKILDVGAGTGLAAREMKKAGFLHIDALEPSEEMLHVAKRDQLYENYFIEYINDKRLDIPDNSYDCVTGSGIFGEGGHVPPVALHEMIRLVKPGGYIVLSTRVTVVEQTEANKDLEPTMARLEKEGKWRQLKRDTQTKLYCDRQGITFVFQLSALGSVAVMEKSADIHVKEKMRSVSTDGLSVEESQETYKRWADSYNQDLLAANYKGPILVTEFLQEYFTPEERQSVKILDVAAGTGLAARELKKAGFLHIDALEPSVEMLHVAKRDHLYENYFIEYINDKRLDIPDNTYDGLTGSGIYGEGAHVPAVALHEMIRLVKPGGYIVLSTRVTLVEQTEANKDLEPTMARLEKEGQWRQLKRDTQSVFYADRQGITFVFQVL